jgi:hypothetical protein
VLIDGRRGLGAAVPIFPMELERAHAMVAMDALEDAAVFNTSVCVMSHNHYCSALLGTFRRTMVTAPFPPRFFHPGQGEEELGHAADQHPVHHLMRLRVDPMICLVASRYQQFEEIVGEGFGEIALRTAMRGIERDGRNRLSE